MKNEHLQQWVFHFNPYTKEWNAFLRTHYLSYFNGMAGDKDVFKSSSMGELLKMVKQKSKECHI